MDTKALFIGVGNPLRRDDGVGVYLLNEIQKKAVSQGVSGDYSFVLSNGEGSRLMETWKGYDQVIIFDALMKQGIPGSTVSLNAHDQKLPSDYFRYSSHAFSLAEAVEMSRVLGCLPKIFRVYAIEGGDFGFGDHLTPAVQLAAQKFVDGFELRTIEINL